MADENKLATLEIQCCSKGSSPVLVDDLGSVEHLNVHLDSVPPVAKDSALLDHVSGLEPLCELGEREVRCSESDESLQLKR